jgi:hypothetical protein
VVASVDYVGEVPLRSNNSAARVGKKGGPGVAFSPFAIVFRREEDFSNVTVYFVKDAFIVRSAFVGSEAAGVKYCNSLADIFQFKAALNNVNVALGSLNVS